MKINAIIREKRLEKGLTQEQVASYLGVSAPAVNKWERAVSYPDITLLPALARLLGTDLNTLLSFQEDLTNQEIALFLNEITATADTQGMEAAYQLATEKVREFPTCDALLLYVGLTLEGLMKRHCPQTDQAAAREAVEALYRRAENSQDPAIANQARIMLFSRCVEREDYDTARTFLDQIPPEPACDKQQLRAKLFLAQGDTTQAAKLLEQRLLLQSTNLQTCLQTLVDIAWQENRPEDAVQLTEIAVQLVQLLGLWSPGAFIAEFHLAVLQQDAGRCLALLQTMFGSGIQDPPSTPSPLYDHLPQKGSPQSLHQQLLPMLLQELESPNHTEYEFLRKNEAFQTFLQVQAGTAKEPVR